LDEVSISKLYNSLRRGLTRRVVVAHGGETLFRTRSLEAVRQYAKAEDLLDFNYDELYSDRTDPYSLIETLRSRPFFAEKRVVVLRNFQKANKALREMVGIYVRSPTDSSLLYVDSTTWKIPGQVTIVPCGKMTRRQLRSWLRKWLKEHKLCHDKDMVQALSLMLSGSLAIRELELKTLLKYLRGKPLTIEVASELFGSGHLTFSDLVSSYRSMDRTLFMQSVTSLQDSGLAPRQIFKVLSTETERAMRAFALDSEGVSMMDIAEDLNIPVFFLRGLFAHKGKWSKVDPVVAVRAISDCNRDLFRSERSPVPLFLFFGSIFIHLGERFR